MAFADEKAKARSDQSCAYYLEHLKESAAFRKDYKTKAKKVVKAA